MTKEEYEDEIQLIKEQNDMEFELYPLIAEIIAPTLKNKLSKRYVFARRKTELGQIYYGLSSFPDIAILDCDFRNEKNKEINIENWEKLRGCIEAKQYNKKLYSLSDIKLAIDNESISDEIGQLLGEILWYKNVLYTNGVKWKLFCIDFYDENEKNVVIEIVKKRISFDASNKDKKEEFVCWKDESFKTIKKITDKIKEKNIVDNCLDNWVEFIDEINKIIWKKV